MIVYHYVNSNSEAKLQFFAEEINKILESGHISHKKAMIHAINIIDIWFEKDRSTLPKNLEIKNFLINYEIFKKFLSTQSLILAFEKYFF